MSPCIAAILFPYFPIAVIPVTDLCKVHTILFAEPFYLVLRKSGVFPGFRYIPMIVLLC